MKRKKQIVFYYATSPSIMIYKIATMFHKRGYETILLTMCEKNRLDYKFLSKAFDKIICSNFQFFKPSFKTLVYTIKRSLSFFKFLISMKLLKPYVVIGISGNNWQLKLVHKHFFRKYPFIYFPYDILSHHLKIEAKPPNFEIEAEKYCFENCEGIIHKGDPNELNFVEGIIHDKINFSNLQLNFQPYCSKEFVIPINKDKLSKKDKEFHIVYIGFLFNDPPSVKKFTECFEKIMNQKIHIHVYTIIDHIPKKQEEGYIKDFFKHVYKNKYFHLHESLGAKELIPEISKYDFGFWPLQKCRPEETKFSTGNKLASYFEAGLPFIYDDKSIFLNKIMSSNNIKLSYNRRNLKDLKKRIKKLDYEKMVKKVEKIRKDFDMDKNFPRLEKFIYEVVQKKYNNIYKI